MALTAASPQALNLRTLTLNPMGFRILALSVSGPVVMSYGLESVLGALGLLGFRVWVLGLLGW